MRIIVLILIVILTGSCSLLEEMKKKQDYLQWNPENPLKWEYFTERNYGKENYKANTRYILGLDISFKKKDTELHIKICNYFSYVGSWVVSTAKTDYLLNHEQRHFDIAEIYARKLRKEILEYNINNVKEIRDLYKKKLEQLRAMQIQYDDETNHSINKQVQAKWNKYIDTELKKYEDYTNCKIVIELE